VNIGINGIINLFPNTLIGVILNSIKNTLFDKYDIRRYSNAFIVLEYLMGL
jgi:hypothetical protein